MIQELKNKILVATKEKNKFVKNLYKTLLGEIQLESSRKNKDLDDKECQAIVKKFIKNIDESLTHVNAPKRTFLEFEKVLLEEFLPETLSRNDILNLINSLGLYDSICTAKNDGMAIGIAMRGLKNYSVEPSDVKDVVENIRKNNEKV